MFLQEQKLQTHKNHHSALFHIHSVLASCGFLAVVIISDIIVHPVVCVVSHPHIAEFSCTGRGSLWERAD